MGVELDLPELLRYFRDNITSREYLNEKYMLNNSPNISSNAQETVTYISSNLLAYRKTCFEQLKKFSPDSLHHLLTKKKKTNNLLNIFVKMLLAFITITQIHSLCFLCFNVSCFKKLKKKS